MAISNTNILIKRSSTTGIPTGGTLKAGELAISYVSNTIFIGNSSGTGVVNVGGQFYTSQIDAATSANTAGAIVKRDASGGFTGQLYGNANTTNYLLNPQNFSVSGGDITASSVSFNGSGAVQLNASLNSISGLSAGTYGGTTVVPILTVAANGRVMAITNSASISTVTTLTVAGNTGSSTLYSGNTLTIQGSTNGVTTTETSSGGSAIVTVGLDTTVLRSNLSSVGPQTISTDLTVSGNLIVAGAQTFVNTSTVITNDSLIKLAANNTVGDVVDIGFYGESNTGSSVVYHGLVREGSGGTSAGNFYLFKNLATDPTGNTVNYAGLTKATLVSNLTGGTVSGLSSAITVSDGGTGTNTLSSGQVLVGNGTGAVQALANVTNYTVTIGTNQTVGSITTDVYGRVTLVTSNTISGLTPSQGGTGTTTSTGTGSVVLNTSPIFSGTAQFATINVGAIFIGNTTYAASGILGALTANNNSYEQFILQNANTGTQASVDFIVSNDKGTDAGFYGDFGMNSSGFSGAGALNMPNAVYLYSANSDLSIGTASANAIHFVTNNGTSDAMTINSNNVVTLQNALGVASGGTGAVSFTAGQHIIYNGTNLVSLANSTYTATGAGAANSTITSLTVDAYGRTTAATFSSISGLTYAQGGTGSTSYTTGQLLVAGTTGLTSLANTTYTATGAGAANSTVSSLTVDAYGRVTAATYSAISGLTVPQGGTGLSSATLNGIVFGNGTAAMGVTVAAGTADQSYSNQILTVTNAGVPVWSTSMDGGTF
jgi:hypothetical protein